MTRADTDGALSVVYQEALLLDRHRFAEWLDLYAEDAVFWVPAWREDNSQTEDPRKELSLIYYSGKDHLRDRIDRLRSGSSPASRPLPRVAHIISSASAEPAGEEEAIVHSSFVTHAYYPRNDRVSAHFGQYEHTLRKQDGGWKIIRKIVRLANDVVPTVLDINAI